MTFSQKIVWYYLKYYFLWLGIAVCCVILSFFDYDKFDIFRFYLIFNYSVGAVGSFLILSKQIDDELIFNLSSLTITKFIFNIISTFNLHKNSRFKTFLSVIFLLITSTPLFLLFQYLSQIFGISKYIFDLELNIFMAIFPSLFFVPFFTHANTYFKSSQLPNFQEKSPEEHARLLNSFAYHNIKNATVNMEWAVNTLAVSSEEKENLNSSKVS